VIPVACGDGVEDRIRTAAPPGVDAFGDGHVEPTLALGVAAGLIAGGQLEVPIANIYPLAQVREA
jgi:hypothetical protein